MGYHKRLFFLLFYIIFGMIILLKNYQIIFFIIFSEFVHFKDIPDVVEFTWYILIIA